MPNCSALKSETAVYISEASCFKDCVLADWSTWQPCPASQLVAWWDRQMDQSDCEGSVTCGNGTTLRERKVLVKEAERKRSAGSQRSHRVFKDGGGRPCNDPLEEEICAKIPTDDATLY